ncbi:MAG: helix-turn-helix transcriptional regulator [Alphaproteobacteria bacterium]|nr:helix-turn-helix transcriptional regulator [Alphaproteobacteria bacterium]
MPLALAATRARDAIEEDELDRIFHALADRTRRALLRRLSGGPARVSDLAAPFAMSLNAVSKHIKVLEQAGLVARDVEGRVHTCTLAADRLRHIEHWLDYYRRFWGDTLEALADYVEGER